MKNRNQGNEGRGSTPQGGDGGGKPAHGTQEWASHSFNLASGCLNGCLYCYAKAMAVRFGRKTPGNWTEPEIVPGKVAMRQGRKNGRIMFPSSHDLDPGNIDACLVVLKKMLDAGNEVLIVSKPRLECVRRLCDELAGFKRQITFRFTIGSADDTVLKAWEPGAPSFAERIDCLKHAFECGFQTSISCEPMLDADVHAVIAKARPFVNDSIWLGVANNLRQTIALNCPGDATAKQMAEALLSVMTNNFVKGLYACYRDDSVIKWKDSIKKIAGLERPTAKGLDV